MHRVAAAAAGSATAPGLPSASVAASIAQDQQNTWKALMEQQMMLFPDGLMRALETATIAAAGAARSAADAAQGFGGPSGSPEPVSVQGIRFGQCTTRIYPIKELHEQSKPSSTRETYAAGDRPSHVGDQRDGTKQLR